MCSLWGRWNGLLLEEGDGTTQKGPSVADEEKFILTDWIQDILDTKQKLVDKEYKGYIVLDGKPPDIMDVPPIIDKDFVGPLPPQVPSRRITGKHPPEEVEFKPDAYDIKRRRAEEEPQDQLGQPATPRSLSMAPTTPARSQDFEMLRPGEQPASELDQPASDAGPTRRLRLNQPEMKSHSRWTTRIRTGHWNVDKSELENNLKKVLKDETRDIRQNCWRSYTSSWNRWWWTGRGRRPATEPWTRRPRQSLTRRSSRRSTTWSRELIRPSPQRSRRRSRAIRPILWWRAGMYWLKKQLNLMRWRISVKKVCYWTPVREKFSKPKPDMWWRATPKQMQKTLNRPHHRWAKISCQHLGGYRPGRWGKYPEIAEYLVPGFRQWPRGKKTEKEFGESLQGSLICGINNIISTDSWWYHVTVISHDITRSSRSISVSEVNKQHDLEWRLRTFQSCDFYRNLGCIPGIVITMAPVIHGTSPVISCYTRVIIWLMQQLAPTAAFQQLRRKLPDSHNPVQRPAGVQSCYRPAIARLSVYCKATT